MSGEQEKGSSRSQPVSALLGADFQRDIAGENCLGMRVAAYRETHPEHGNKYGYRYSEHWSTPSQSPAVTVERLFTEASVCELLARITLDPPSWWPSGGNDSAREMQELFSSADDPKGQDGPVSSPGTNQEDAGQ